MIKEFRDYAVEILAELHLSYKILRNYTMSGKWVSDELWTEELPEKLKEKGYWLSSCPDKQGYREVFQPPLTCTKTYGCTCDKKPCTNNLS